MMIKKYLSILSEEIKNSKSFRVTSQTFIIRLAGLGLIFINQVLLARLMGAKGFGNYTVIFTWLNFLAVFSMFGFDTSVLRYFPSHLARHEWSKLKGFLRFTGSIILMLSVMSSAGILVYLLYHSHRFVISFSEAWFWSVLVLPFLAFIHYYSSVLRAMHRIKISLIPFYVLLPVMVSMISYLCYRFNQEKLNVDAALMIYFFCVVIVFLFISRRLRMELKEQVTEAVPDYERKEWFSVSVTLLVISLFTLVLKKIDVLFISNYFGNTHAGIYAAASMISGFVPFGLIVVDYVFAPRISELYESRQMEKLQGMIRNTSRLIVLITLPIALVILVFGKLILQVFGTAFIASYLPLIILTAGQLVNAFTGMVAAMMTMTGNQKTFLLVLVISGMLDVALNMILVPSMGMTGGAIASAGSLIFLNLVLYFIVKKKLRIRISAFIF